MGEVFVAAVDGFLGGLFLKDVLLEEGLDLRLGDGGDEAQAVGGEVFVRAMGEVRDGAVFDLAAFAVRVAQQNPAIDFAVFATVSHVDEY